MTKREGYRRRLRELGSWDSYLLQESGLPGPRGNIELAQAVADEGDARRFRRYIGYAVHRAPTGSPQEFLAFCGTVGLGRLLAEGDEGVLATLLVQASDPRWRVREAVAMALQRLGDTDMDRLVARMRVWAGGSPLEQRAAAAALCEPRLLVRPKHARAVLSVLDRITASLEGATSRRGEEFKTLRKGLGYCWSVAVSAIPEEGKAHMEKWLGRTDKDVRWVMMGNLGKARMARMDAEWVKKWRERVR